MIELKEWELKAWYCHTHFQGTYWLCSQCLYWKPCNDVETWIKKENYHTQKSAFCYGGWPELVCLPSGTRSILEKDVDHTIWSWQKTRRQAVREPKAMAQHSIGQASAQARITNSLFTHLINIFVIAILNWHSLPDVVLIFTKFNDRPDSASVIDFSFSFSKINEQWPAVLWLVWIAVLKTLINWTSKLIKSSRYKITSLYCLVIIILYN